MKRYHFETSCIHSTAELIGAMRDTATEVTYRTVLHHCEGLIAWACGVGYDKRCDQGLTLRDDRHVTYHRSTYRGLPCYYVCWSGIEHIWVKRASSNPA